MSEFGISLNCPNATKNECGCIPDECLRYGIRPESAFSPPYPDLINHPPHYTAHPSGIECITITEHMSFNVGNAMKYLWRADEKGFALDDLRKAAWYIAREIAKRERG